MFDLANIFELLKVEPGHGMVQSVLLFMIWLNSRGLKKDMDAFKDNLFEGRIYQENRFEKVEERIIVLEQNRGMK